MKKTGKRKNIRQRPRRKDRASGLKVFLWSLASIATLAALVAIAFDIRRYLYESDRFDVTEVDVGGAVLLTQTEIITAIALPSPVNLFEIDDEAVAARVAALPRVRSAAATTRIPCYLGVTVDERMPVALVGKEPVLEIDRKGYVLGPSRRDPSVTPYPHIAGIQLRDEFIVGGQLTVDGIQEALILCELLVGDESLPLLGSVSIDITDTANIAMKIKGKPAEIFWGTGDYRRKLAKLMAVYYKTGGTLPHSEYIDLRQSRFVPAK
jgi:hypothetical protein